MERCPSGLRGTPGERVYPKGTVGSNPTLSAVICAPGVVAQTPAEGYDTRTDEG